MLLGEFWGTGAAEGIPAPFCQCEVCREARELKGKYQRMRSCFRLSDKMMLDLGADAVAQSMKYGDLTDVEHVLISHTHDDHLNPHMLMEAMWSKKFRKTLHYYFTEEAFEIVNKWKEHAWILKGKVANWEEEGIVAFHQLKFGETYKIDDMKVTPFPGTHRGNIESYSAMYLVELPDKRTLFYGLDSGAYLPETINALSKVKVDIFISEATGGVQDSKQDSHMCLQQVRDLTDKLYHQGTLHDNSCIYLSHINHRSSHLQMERRTEQLQFPVKAIVAWDGLRIF